MQTRNGISWFKHVAAACLILIFGLAWRSPAQADTFGGRAFAAYVNVPTLGAGPLYLADTGELPALGGVESADLLGAEIPSALSGEVLNSATAGDAGQASSSSSLAGVTVLPGNVAQLTASFVRSEALATATGTGGSAEIYDLMLGGVPVQVTGAPNQTVEIPGAPIVGLLGEVIGTGAPLGTLIINEQTVTSDGVSQAITVNALRLILATGEEVILGSATSLVNPTGQLTLADGRGRANAAGKVAVAKGQVAPARKVALGNVRLASLSALGKPAGKVTLASARNGLSASVVPAVLPGARSGKYCPANTKPVRNLLWRLGLRAPIILAEFPEECLDFITGGGFIFDTHDGRRVNFGFNAGFKNGTQVPLQVHFNSVDHGTGRHIKVQEPTSATSYGIFDNNCNCRVFSGPDRFMPDETVTVTACDNGEPGRSDTIEISTPTYFASGTLSGGNIQLHKRCC